MYVFVIETLLVIINQAEVTALSASKVTLLLTSFRLADGCNAIAR